MVVHGAGRVPEIDDLDLAIAGIESENKRGINPYFRTCIQEKDLANSHIYPKIT
jgi:pyruvate/2-oxoglutarate dehydrogenase complex dihydrolipoamide dehydrogenase (E3) component